MKNTTSKKLFNNLEEKTVQLKNLMESNNNQTQNSHYRKNEGESDHTKYRKGDNTDKKRRQS